MHIPFRHVLMDRYGESHIKSYYARLYYRSSVIHTWEVYFVIVQDMESSKAVSCHT